MPAWDNVSLAPPLSGQNYNAGFRNFLNMGNSVDVPGNYFTGTQQGLQRAMQTAFPNGIPPDAQGRPDYNAVINKGVQLGGVDYATKLMQMMLPLQMGQEAAGALRNLDQWVNSGETGATAAAGGGAQTTAGGAVSPGRPNMPGVGIANLTPGAGAGGQNQQSRPVAAGNEPSITAIAKRMSQGGDDVTSAVPAVARAMGINPLAKLSPAEANDAVTRLAGGSVQAAKNDAPQAGNQQLGPVDEESGGVPTRATSAAEQNGNAARAPFMGTAGGAPGVGASNQPGTTAVPSGIAPEGTARSPTGDGTVAARPPNEPTDPIQAINAAERDPQIQRLLKAAALAEGYAATVGKYDPQGAKAAMQTAAGYRDRAKLRLEAIAKNVEQTPEIKDYIVGRNPNESMPQYQARVAGAKKAATAPYEIAQAAIREGGRPVSIKPNEVVTTGATVNPALESITGWAASRLGLPTETAPTGQPGALGTQSGAAPAGPGQPPRLVRNPDGSVTSSVTPTTESLQKATVSDYEEAHKTYMGAQDVKRSLTNMEDAFRKLNSSGWSSTGTGAQTRIDLAKAVNSVWSVLGVKGQDLPFDPTKIANAEELVKETTRLGFALSRTLGAREAMQVVQGAIKANPNLENSELGAEMVLNTIRQNADRDTDYYDFLTKYAAKNNYDLFGGANEFYRTHPPQMYARRAIVQTERSIPQEAIDYLRSNPKTSATFDKTYGASGLAKLFLGEAAQ